MSSVVKHKCPKCLKRYVPEYRSKEEAAKACRRDPRINLIVVEQHMSKICSDMCWDASSPEELTKYKFSQSGRYHVHYLPHGMMLFTRKSTFE